MSDIWIGDGKSDFVLEIRQKRALANGEIGIDEERKEKIKEHQDATVRNRSVGGEKTSHRLDYYIPN